MIRQVIDSLEGRAEFNAPLRGDSAENLLAVQWQAFEKKLTRLDPMILSRQS